MTNIFLDIETQGLNSNNFVIAYAETDKNDKGQFFYKKEDLWNYILEIGKKQKKRNRSVNVYAHNHSYDFYGYAPIHNNKIKYFNLRPFIAEYKNIHFLDTLAIFPTSLKKIGEDVGLKKLETDFNKIKVGMNPLELTQIKPYVQRDVKIIKEAILKLRKELKDMGGCPKRIYTISQIAIHYLMNQIINNNSKIYNYDLPIKERRLYLTQYEKEIKEAYKGARTECFKTGKQNKITYIDINSLYPFAITQMQFPDLKTERKIEKPLQQHTIPELLEKPSIHKCMILNEFDNIGTLIIKQREINVPLKKGQIAIGTFTNIELETALRYGHKIIDIEYSIIWEETKNEISPIIKELYELKKQAKNPFKRNLYKLLMNCSFGKLAQDKTYKELIFDNVEKAKEYEENGYKVIDAFELSYLYEKEIESKEKKKYYAPIIPTMINAWSRCYMRDQFEKFNEKDLLYTDTDSIMFKGRIPHNIRLGLRLGEFKVEKLNANVTIYGNKGYVLNGETVFSGVPKQKGNSKLKYKRQNTILKKNTGTFTEYTRDVKEQEEKYLNVIQELKEEEVLIEKGTEIDYFLHYLNKEQIL